MAPESEHIQNFDFARTELNAVLIESSPDAIYLVDADEGRIVWCNPALSAMYEYSVDELTGMTVFDLHDPGERDSANAVFQRIIEQGESVAECWTRTKSGRPVYVELRARPIQIGGRQLVMSAARDLTEHKRFDDELQESLQRAQTLAERLEIFNRLLQRISFSLDMSWMLLQASYLLRSFLPHDRASLTLVSPVGDVAVIYAVAGADGALSAGSLVSLTGSNVGNVLKTGTPRICTDLRQEQPFAEKEQLLALGIRSVVMVPIWCKEALIGTLNFGSFEPGAYSDEHVSAAQEIAEQMAEPLNRARYVIDALRLGATERPVVPAPPGHTADVLTPRQLTVLSLLASGARNKEVAEQLSLSVNTVKFHIENIYRKLGVQTRTQAMRVALERGLLES